MKNISFLKIASIILVGLFLIAIIPWISNVLSSKEDVDIKNIAPSINLSSFTENTVTSVKITRKDADDVVLEKKGDAWKIGADDADTTKITALFQSLETLMPHEMVSKNEDNFSKFGVTKDDGIRLEISTSGNPSVFYIGADSDVPQEFYLRKDGIKNTYSARGTLRNILTQSVSYWKKVPTEEKTSDSASADKINDNAGSFSKEAGE